MPADGNVFRNDPMYRAREIWDERCAGCHSLAGAGGDKGPDLKDYNSRAWIRGFLTDPDGPLYMGPAKIEKGMRPVAGTPEEMDALVEYVYAETGATDVDAVAGGTRPRPAVAAATATPATTSTARARTTAPT